MIASAQTLAPVTDPHAYGSPVALHIEDDSSVSMDGAVVEQIAGTSFYMRLYWGQAFIRLLVRTDQNTVFVNKFDQPMTVGQVSKGDFLSIKGTITSSSNSLDFSANSVKDWSIQTETANFAGIVASYATSTTGFMLKQPNGALIAVNDGGATTTISKGSLSIYPYQISVGDVILSASGVFDYLSQTLNASSITVYQDMSIFQPKNYQGTLVSVSNGQSPSLVVSVGGVNYTVNLTNGADILDTRRDHISLGRFLPGDTVRFYGSIEESDHTSVTADTVRNISL